MGKQDQYSHFKALRRLEKKTGETQFALRYAIEHGFGANKIKELDGYLMR